jgi:hypothetical protein
VRKREGKGENESVRGIAEKAGKRGRKKVREKLIFFGAEIWCREGVAQVSFGVVSPSVSDAGMFHRRKPWWSVLVGERSLPQSVSSPLFVRGSRKEGRSLPQSVSPTAPSSEGAVDVFSSSIIPHKIKTPVSISAHRGFVCLMLTS